MMSHKGGGDFMNLLENTELSKKESEADQRAQEKILQMIKEGHATWGGHKLSDREPVGTNAGTKQISQIIEEDRG
jgi:hypothetical protein